MILQALYELYGRISQDSAYGLAPPGYSIQNMAFRVVLRPDGTLFEIQDIRELDGKSLRPRAMVVPGQGKAPGSGINPGFLWDNTGYMLGFKPDDPNPSRSRETFFGFRDRHLEMETEVDAAPFSAVCRFLESWDPEDALDYPLLKEMKSGFGVFQIQGEAEYVHEEMRVEAWWRADGRPAPRDVLGQCLVTGLVAPVALTHSPKIKGAGGQTSGTAIVSFNATAYESYGKEQSDNAPVSADAVFRYANALNALLQGPMRRKHRISLADTTVVFWTDRPSIVEDFFAQFCTRGSEGLESEEAQDEGLLGKIGAFLDAMRQGQSCYPELGEDYDETEFYVLGLAPNAARLSARFFHRASLTEFLDNLRSHFLDIATDVQPASKKRRADPEFPSIRLLLDQTCPLKAGKPDREHISPVLVGPLLRAVFAGAPYPEALASSVLRRIRADRRIDYPRACVLKGYLVRNKKQEVSMSLDSEDPRPAYRLGRAFAALEKTQKDALGDGLNKTIRDSYYGSASSTPRVVFPRLLRTYQHHLAKLEGGRRVNRERLLQEILDPLSSFPAHFNLEDQGFFALGYYHQTRDFYTKKDAPHHNPEGDPPE